jgi:hypothetical protein
MINNYKVTYTLYINLHTSTPHYHSTYPIYPTYQSEMSSGGGKGGKGKAKTSSETKVLTTRSSKAGLQVCTFIYIHPYHADILVPCWTYPQVGLIHTYPSDHTDTQILEEQERKQCSSRSQSCRLRRCHHGVLDRRGSRACRYALSSSYPTISS